MSKQKVTKVYIPTVINEDIRRWRHSEFIIGGNCADCKLGEIKVK